MHVGLHVNSMLSLVHESMSGFLYSIIVFDKSFITVFLYFCLRCPVTKSLGLFYAPLQTNHSFLLMWWFLLIVPLRAHFGHFPKALCQGITFPPRWAVVQWLYGLFLTLCALFLVLFMVLLNITYMYLFSLWTFFFLQSRLKTFSSFNPPPDQSSLIHAMKVRPMPLNPRAPSASTSQ